MSRRHTGTTTVTMGPRVGLGLRDAAGRPFFAAGSPLHAFQRRSRPALQLTVRHERLPPCESLELVLDSKAPWRVYRRGRAHVVALRTGKAESSTYEVAVVDFAAGRGDLFLAAPTDAEVYPFEFPLSEMVFSRLLAARESAIIHAAGIACGGRGVLLAGHSRAGKTTLASLFARRGRSSILSDDRVIVHRGRGRPRMYGTPWPGTGGHALPESAPLDAIFFLRHAAQNRARRLDPTQAAARLLALAVIPYWDPPAARKVADLGVALASTVRCYDFGFVPDRSAVEFLGGLDLAG